MPGNLTPLQYNLYLMLNLIWLYCFLNCVNFRHEVVEPIIKYITDNVIYGLT